jgi:hypothetical protein
MTDDELDRACAEEAERQWMLATKDGTQPTQTPLGVIAARLARKGYRPPEPVDPDVLAYREWAALPEFDVQSREEDAFVAGARMAREQEQGRAKVLVKYVESRAQAGILFAAEALAAYKAGRTAR